ncbi:MAG: DNA polymerase III, subunit gamma and tau [Acidobacteria bacterium 37-65-4]|nr:MAG: DNA polymerase III, subunit gamma and tau [Acidobacteria bacterium 37-65-4]
MIKVYEALARKYRPQAFEDMVGQGAVVKTLQNALTTGKIHPAYIFSGIRGVGKTTAARLFAKGMNCLEGPTATPCGKCPSCVEIKRAASMDVLEIDAATNTQVEKIRDLIDASRYTPARDRYRIFIIDEVHMLSLSSFNALLKTLEEPPAHARFLLATTEAHKIPETIQSRAQHFQFRRVPEHQVAAFLAQICAKEEIVAEPAALSLIAKSGEGSVRDSLTLLDRIVAYTDGPVSEAAAVEVLGVTGREGLLSLLGALSEGRASDIPEFVDKLLDRGQSLERFLSDLAGLVRELVRLKLGGADGVGDPRLAPCAGRFSEEDLLRLWDLLLVSQQRLKGAPEADALLELQLVKAALLPRILPLDRLLGRVPDLSTPEPEPPSQRQVVTPGPPAEAPPPEPDLPASKVQEGAPSPDGSQPSGGLRFKAIIPFKRMDEDEARAYDDQADDRIRRFRENAARRLPLMQETLKGASLSLDPDGVLHVSLPPTDITGAALLNNRERREALEAVARESGLPGSLAVETGARPELEPSAARSPSHRPDSLTPAENPAVDNVLRVLGGRLIRVTAPPALDSAEGGPHGEPE